MIVEKTVSFILGKQFRNIIIVGFILYFLLVVFVTPFFIEREELWKLNNHFLSGDYLTEKFASENETINFFRELYGSIFGILLIVLSVRIITKIVSNFLKKLKIINLFTFTLIVEGIPALFGILSFLSPSIYPTLIFITDDLARSLPLAPAIFGVTYPLALKSLKENNKVKLKKPVLLGVSFFFVTSTISFYLFYFANTQFTEPHYLLKIGTIVLITIIPVIFVRISLKNFQFNYRDAGIKVLIIGAIQPLFLVFLYTMARITGISFFTELVFYAIVGIYYIPLEIYLIRKWLINKS